MYSASQKLSDISKSNISQGVKPINKLDEAAMNHDIAYAKSKDLDERHKADYKLQEDAGKRVIADDSSLGEKAAAYLTTNAMKVKRWLGAGIKYPLDLDEKDQKLILEGIKLKKPITLNLDHEQLIRTKNSVWNESYLPLSTYQIKQIKKGIKQKKPVKLQLKIPQLEYINENRKTGGFLPALIGALPIITAASTIAKNNVFLIPIYTILHCLKFLNIFLFPVQRILSFQLSRKARNKAKSTKTLNRNT